MTTYQRACIATTDDLIAVADHAGSHFFSADTMKWWGTRVLSTVLPLDGAETKPGRRYVFVTSDMMGDTRRYSVRMATLSTVRDDRPAVEFDTLEFALDTRAEALKVAHRVTA